MLQVIFSARKSDPQIERRDKPGRFGKDVVGKEESRKWKPEKRKVEKLFPLPSPLL